MSSSLVQSESFSHILRVLNTNVEGKRTAVFAMCAIKGVGRRFSDLACKKAQVPAGSRAGDMTPEQIETIVSVINNPKGFRVPNWFLNRQKDRTTGANSQLAVNHLDAQLRNDLERLKKIRAHRGIRHYWGVRVRGQHTKTTGRRGKTVGILARK